MDHNEIAREWFHYADTDLKAAKHLRTMIPTPIEIICYHCQQSSEKYLKGYLALNGGKIQKTHDLAILNKLCQNFHPEFAKVMGECINLTDFGIQTRYPFELDVNDEDVPLAIESAEKIKQFVMEILK